MGKTKVLTSISCDPSFSEVCHAIDWEALRTQRRVLIDSQSVLTNNSFEEFSDEIEGVIKLIEAIMDAAVDREGISEEVVFGVKEGDE